MRILLMIALFMVIINALFSSPIKQNDADEIDSLSEVCGNWVGKFADEFTTIAVDLLLSEFLKFYSVAEPALISVINYLTVNDQILTERDEQSQPVTPTHPDPC